MQPLYAQVLKANVIRRGNNLPELDDGDNEDENDSNDSYCRCPDTTTLAPGRAVRSQANEVELARHPQDPPQSHGQPDIYIGDTEVS